MASDRFEYILLEIGASFKWHLFIFGLATFPDFFSAFHNLSTLILFYTPEHRCRIPYWDDSMPVANNWTLDRIQEYAIPRMTGSDFYSRCQIYNRNYTAALTVPWSSKFNIEPEVDIMNATTPSIIKCSSWIYETDQMVSSVVTQWNLVCDSTGYGSIGKGAYMIGMIFGSIGFGYLSDRYGRRRVGLFIILQYIISSMLATFAPTYSTYIFLRILTGMAGIGIYLCVYIILNETVLPKFRGSMSIGIFLFAAIGSMTSAGLLHISGGDWKTFNLVSATGLFTMFLYYWLLPESPRWLILQNRQEEAVKIVRRIADMGDKKDDITDEQIVSMVRKCHHAMAPNGDSEGGNSRSKWKLVLEVVTSPALRFNTLVCCFLWISVTFGYYGIMLSSTQFATSLRLVVFMGGLVDAPSGILGVLLIKLMSRRTVISSTFTISGLCALTFFFIPREYQLFQSIIGMIGKLTICLTFGVVYVLTAELFPTDHRNVAMGLCSTVGRAGALIAPFVVDIIGSIDVRNSMAVFGVELILAGAGSLLVKETADKVLPDTEMDVRNFDDLEFRDKILDETRQRIAENGNDIK